MPTVTVQPDGTRVRVPPGRSILEGLYAAGYAYRIGCRRGGCGICKADLVAGTVSYPQVVADTVLSEQERARGVCLICRAVPDGDVAVSLPPDFRLRCVAPFLAVLARS